MPACRKCGTVKASSEFYPDKSKRTGHHSICKECVKADRKRRYADDPLKYNEQTRRYQAENRDKIRAARWKRKLSVIAKYGGECACCGEVEPEFLTIDHIGGWGKDHRSNSGWGYNMVDYLYGREFIEGLRILCFNCNCALGIFNRCPHQSQ